LEYNFPCVSLCTAPGNGRLGSELAPLEAGSPDVLVSALYSKQGKSYVRMYEYRGRESRASLKYLLGKARLTEVDLAERGGKTLSAISPADESESLIFRPWQIRTICIEPLN
jgi:hypothetical protein